MIKEIKIENFKSIESLNLELGRLNVFIGANGSGKSNILEGIVMGGAAIDNKLDYEFLVNRGFRGVDEKTIPSGFLSNTNIENTFSFNFDNNRKIEVILSGLNRKQYKSTSKGVTIWIGESDNKTEKVENEGYDHLEDTLKKVEFDAKEVEKILTQLKEKNVELSRKLAEFERNRGRYSDTSFLVYSPENYFLRRFEEETQIKPLGIRGEGMFSHLVEIFKEKPKLFEKVNENLRLLDWFDGFEIPNDLMFTEKRIKIKDRFLEEGLQYFDQRSANEGFLYLLFYLTLFISDETPKFFAIDNIDNAMNPKLGSELIKILAKLAKDKDHEKQVILTTHNPAILDGINLNDDDQRLFVIYRNGDGHTKARRILRKETPQGQRPVPLSEQFLRGYLGGLPDNF